MINNPESLKSNLYVARDIEGDPNSEELRVIRELERRLREDPNHPEFVGLVPRGSVILGYKNEKSDIDVWLIYDSTKVDEENEHWYADPIFNEFEFKKYNMGIMFEYLNPERIQSDPFFADPDLLEIGRDASAMIFMLTKIVVGERIEFYRDMLRNALNQISPKQKDWLRTKVTKGLAHDDYLSLDRRGVERIPDLKDSLEDILKAREKLWEQRFDKVWGN